MKFLFNSLCKFIVSFILIFCNIRLASGDTTSNSPEKKPIYKIGAILTLTGPLASPGMHIKNGINLALEDINSTQPFKLDIIFEDSQSEVRHALSAAKKLLEIDYVKVIIGPIRSNDILALAPLTNAKEVLLFTPISASDEISSAGDFVFRNRETASLHGLRMADYLRLKNIREVSVFVAESSNSLSYVRAFEKEFKAKGGTVREVIEYQENSRDFKPEITRAIHTKPEALYVSGATGIDSGLLVKQIRQLGYRGLIAGTMLMQSQEFLDASEASSEEVIFTSSAYSNKNPNTSSFDTRYLKDFNQPSDIFAANAYDAVMLIGEGIKQCKGVITPCIRDFLYSVKNYPGVGGDTTFDKNGDVLKSVALNRINDRQYKEIVE